MSSLESRPNHSNHVEQMDPAERFAKLTPWQIAQNTMLFAQGTIHGSSKDYRITQDAQFEHEGAEFAINLRARGEHPKEISLHGKRLIDGEQTHAFVYKITRKGVIREGEQDHIGPLESERLIPLLGKANLELTQHNPEPARE